MALTPSCSSYLNAEADRSDGDEALRRRSLALAELVTTIAYDAPLIMIIDDVHWMDSQSRTMLASLCERLEVPGTLVVTASRDAAHFAERSRVSQTLAIPPLSLLDVGALVASIALPPAETWADKMTEQLHVASAGSPLLVMETLQLAIERKQLLLENGVWTSSDTTALGSTLESGGAIQQRLEALPAAARRALLVLAAAGLELDDNSVAALLPLSTHEGLAELERRGLVAHGASGYRVSHDEIASLAISLATEGEARDAHEMLATHLERHIGNSTSSLVRAAAHSARTRNVAQLDRIFRKAVLSAGHSRRPHAILSLAREVLGDATTVVSAEALLRRLPLYTRASVGSLATGLVMAVSVIAFLVGTQWPQAPLGNDTSVTLISRDADGLSFVSIELADEPLDSTRALNAQSSTALFPSAVLDKVKVTGRLRDGTFVGSAMLDNGRTGGIDLVRVSDAGYVERVRAADHDQDSPVVSPNGRDVAFLTGQWHTSQRMDIALFKSDSNAILRVTRSDASETSIRWSADGSQLAFVRSHATKGAAQLCTIAIASSEEVCQELASDHIPTSVVGWQSDHELLVMAERIPSFHSVLLRVDIGNATTTTVDSTAGKYFLNPNGRWALCLCEAPEFGGPVLQVFRTVDPNRKQTIRRDGAPIRSLYEPFVVWRMPSRIIASIVVSGNDHVFSGQRAVLRARAFDSVGVEQGLGALQWSSTDSGVIVVDSMGVAEARGRGVARIAAHAGTVSSAEMTIAVHSPSASPRMNEQWQDGLAGRWWSFGWPAPKLNPRRGATTLLVNGDGHLNSGIISRETYDASNGVGVRVLVQLPILRAQWQALLVRLDPIATDAQLQQWRTDERKEGQLPSSWDGAHVSSCTVRTPRREGGEFTDFMSLTVLNRETPMLRTPRIADGRLHVITLQVLGDGRCALAIDDTVTASSETSIRLDRPLRVVLEGQSVDTEIEVRSVEVWTGLRPGIDWNATGSALRGARLVGPVRKRPMFP